MYTRTNGGMAEAVNQGIALDCTKGAATAWAYMKYFKVPQQVILRVLAEPGLRRLVEIAGPLEETDTDVYANVIHLWRAPAA